MKMVKMGKKSKPQAMRDMKQVDVDNNVIVGNKISPFSWKVKSMLKR